jgi:hypothetical protein
MDVGKSRMTIDIATDLFFTDAFAVKWGIGDVLIAE